MHSLERERRRRASYALSYEYICVPSSTTYPVFSSFLVVLLCTAVRSTVLRKQKSMVLVIGMPRALTSAKPGVKLDV